MAIDHDVIRASFEAWNAQDRESFCASMTEDVRYHVPASVPFSGSLDGREEVGQFAEQLWSFFPQLESIVEKVHAQADRAVIRGVHVGTTDDGTTHRVPFQNAVLLRDGRICEVRQQLDAGLVMRAVASQLAAADVAPAR